MMPAGSVPLIYALTSDTLSPRPSQEGLWGHVRQLGHSAGRRNHRRGHTGDAITGRQSSA